MHQRPQTSTLFPYTTLFRSGIDRQDCVLVLDEIAQMGVLLTADRRFQRQRLLGDLEHLAHLLERHAELLGDLKRPRLKSSLVEIPYPVMRLNANALDHLPRD